MRRVVWAVAVGLLATSLLQLPVSAWHPVHVPHSPVQFNSNSDFGATQGPFCAPNVANGVVGGCGTESDPWRIEGWLFVAPPTLASIEFRSTTDHVLIKDNHFVRDAVFIENAQNIRFENNYIDLGIGIFVYDQANGPNGPTRDLVIKDNVMLPTVYGVFARGLLTSRLHGVHIEGNSITGSSDAAIFLGSVTGLIIKENSIADGNRGIVCTIGGCSGTIEANLIEDNSNAGIKTPFSSLRGEIRGNIIRDNGAGITGAICSPSHGLANNNIIGNSNWGVKLTDCPLDARGNWWGDPTGPGGVGPGAGDEILIASDLANVVYDPWLTAPDQNAGPQE